MRVVGVERFQFKSSENTSIKQIPKDILRRVKALKNIQLENVKHEIEYYKKIHHLDLEFKKIFDANNERRKRIYLGQYEPTDSECWWLDPNEDGSMETMEMENMNIDMSGTSPSGSYGPVRSLGRDPSFRALIPASKPKFQPHGPNPSPHSNLKAQN